MRGGTSIAMQTKPIILLLCIISTDAFAGAGGNIGQHDNRTYGSLQEPLYSAIGRLSVGCTAGFIDTNTIITNHHCFVACQNRCTLHFWDGVSYQESAITAVTIPRENANQSTNGTDWVLYRTEIPNPNFKTIAPESTLGPVDRGGFGLLRVIKDDEIPRLKQIYSQVTNQHKEECKKKYPNDNNKLLACIHAYVTTELARQGIEPLFQDSKRFKIQKCNIHTFVDDNKRVRTDCDSAGGDSGAPLLRGNVIVGLNNAGPQTVFSNDDKKGAFALNTNNFYGPIRALQSLHTHISTANTGNPATSSTTTTTATTPTTTTTATTPTQVNEPATSVPPAPEPQNQQLITDPAQIQQMMLNALEDFNCD